MAIAQNPSPPKPDRSGIAHKARKELNDYIVAWASVHKLTKSEVFWLLSESVYLEAQASVGHERRRRQHQNGKASNS